MAPKVEFEINRHKCFKLGKSAYALYAASEVDKLASPKTFQRLYVVYKEFYHSFMSKKESTAANFFHSWVWHDAQKIAVSFEYMLNTMCLCFCFVVLNPAEGDLREIASLPSR